MKIKVESEELTRAVQKLEGIEITLEDAADAEEALNLVLRKAGLLDRPEYGQVTEIKVRSLQKYETSAVNYKLIFMLEFVFEADVSMETKVEAIRMLQNFLENV